MNIKVLAGAAVGLYAMDRMMGHKNTTKVALLSLVTFAGWYGYKSGLIAALTKDIPVPARITNVWTSAKARLGY